MSKLIIVVLVLVWAVVLLPDVFQRLSHTRRGDSIRSFSDALSSLGRSHHGGSRVSNVIDLRSRTPRRDPSLDGAPVVRRAPRPGGGATSQRRVQGVPPHVRKRRQEVLTCLGCAVVLTLLATVAFGGPFLYLQLLADLLLVGYLLLLAQVSGMAGIPAVPAPTASRRAELAPLSPLDGLSSMDALRTGTVGETTPFEPAQLAN